MTTHSRDRVILTQGVTAAGTATNIPQFPSGRRAAANLPGFTSTVALAVAVNQTPITIDLSQDLAPVIYTQAANATSP